MTAPPANAPTAPKALIDKPGLSSINKVRKRVQNRGYDPSVAQERRTLRARWEAMKNRSKNIAPVAVLNRPCGIKLDALPMRAPRSSETRGPFPPCAFARLCREIATGIKPEVRLQPSALWALQETAEAFLIDHFRRSQHLVGDADDAMEQDEGAEDATNLARALAKQCVVSSDR